MKLTKKKSGIELKKSRSKLKKTPKTPKKPRKSFDIQEFRRSLNRLIPRTMAAGRWSLKSQYCYLLSDLSQL